MKNRIISLSGTVRRLLATFGPKTTALWLLLFGLAALAGASSQAAKPGGGGGGGGGGTPTGTIYYIGPWPDATTGGTAVMTTIDPAGDNKTVLGLGLFGDPSYSVHGGHRWFVGRAQVFTDEYYPNGTKRMEVLALRGDYHYADNNTPITRVQLTDDPLLELWGTQWLSGDGYISFIGRRWSSTDPDAIILEGGIYAAAVAFDVDGNVTGLASPVTLSIPLPLVEAPAGDLRTGLQPDVAFYSWAPTRDMIAHSNRADSELWVADVLGGRTRIFAAHAHMPKWSPDGTKIAFTRGGIWTIDPNGERAKEIVNSTPNWDFNHAHFSPDGKYLVFCGQSRADGNQDLFRATVTGRGLTQLTSTPHPFAEQVFEWDAGWRE